AANRPCGEVAARFAMAGIIEPHAGTALFRRPAIERFGLGTLHIGFEAAEPKQAWSRRRTLAFACAHGDGPPGQRRFYRQRCQASFAHGRLRPGRGMNSISILTSSRRKRPVYARGTSA